MEYYTDLQRRSSLSKYATVSVITTIIIVAVIIIITTIINFIFMNHCRLSPVTPFCLCLVDVLGLCIFVLVYPHHCVSSDDNGAPTVPNGTVDAMEGMERNN